MADGLETLIERLDAAVRLGTPAAVTARIKESLESAIQDRRVDLPARFHQTRPDGYARRLLHRSHHLGYTAVVMTWAPGQRTPLHDHAGIWCVEGVVEGKMDVTQYDLIQEAHGRFRFEERGCIHAEVGSAGCLIPPFEYHVLANPTKAPSITLHVYGGEMTSCHIFEPQDDGAYLCRERPLNYHD